MVLSDKRVIWHPGQSNRFIVGGGSQITLYEWVSEQPEIRHVSSQHDLQFMKCFAWSPAAVPSDLVAVGSSTGRVDLLRLEASRFSNTSPGDNVLSAGPIISLPVRNQRSCNTLAFCPSDANYLAVGLDKVRGDGSLVVWDVRGEMGVFGAGVQSEEEDLNAAYPSKSTSRNPINAYPRIPRTDFSHRTDQRIVQTHAQTEVVSSLAWIPQTAFPYLLLAGISTRWLRLFDLRSPPSSGPSYVSSVASKVNGIAVDPFDSTRFASWGDGVVTIWDMRKLSTSGTHSNTNNATPTPLLTFSERDAAADGAFVSAQSKSTSSSSISFARTKSSSSIASPTGPYSPAGITAPYTTLEFSHTRRGMLATLSKDATYVRLWNIMETRPSLGVSAPELEDGLDNNTGSRSRGSSVVGRTPSFSRKSWAPWAETGSSNVAGPENRTRDPGRDTEQGDYTVVQGSTLLYDTRKISGSRHIVALSSFALVPPIYPSHQAKSRVVLVTSTGEISLQSIHDAPKILDWSPRGDLIYGPSQASTQTVGNTGGFGIVRGNSIEDDNEEITGGQRGESAEGERWRSHGQSALNSLKGNLQTAPSAITGARDVYERGRSRNPTSNREDITTALANSAPSPPLFGRGDAEGFPALSRVTSSAAGLATTKPLPEGFGVQREQQEKRRTFSPAAALKAPLHPQSRSQSQPTANFSKPSAERTTRNVSTQNRTKGLLTTRKAGHSAQVVGSDISMVMRRRAIKGYSLSDALMNASIVRELDDAEATGTGSTENKVLADLWEWIQHSRNLLSSPTPILNGYDFSYAGVWGIWDGPSTVGGSGTVPKLVAQDTLNQRANILGDLGNRGSNNSTTVASGHVSSSVNTMGSNISTSPGSALGGVSTDSGLGTSGDAEATPVHRDRLELPTNTLDPQVHDYGYSRNTGSRSRRSKSPATNPLRNDPDWHDALLTILSRISSSAFSESSPIFPYAPTSKPLQRLLCLQLIGWGFVLRDELLMAEVRRWEREGKGDNGYARAAAWLVFTGRYGGGFGMGNKVVPDEGAVECLLRSQDESHHMMSGVVAALAPFASTASAPTSSNSQSSRPILSSPLREHYARLTNKLQDPYLRALLTHLTCVSSSTSTGVFSNNSEVWLEILYDEADLVPFRERLALAFCFLDDEALTSYLHRCRDGDVDALMVTGLGTFEGREVLGKWVDRGGDVQSAALIGWLGVVVGLGSKPTSKISPRSRKQDKVFHVDPKVKRWVEAYRDLLDMLKLFHCRVEYDIERSDVLQSALLGLGMPLSQTSNEMVDLAPKQILIRCNYCNKTVTPRPSDTGSNSLGLGLGLGAASMPMPKGKPTTCPNCNRALPRCSICLMTLGIIQDSIRDSQLAHSNYRDTIDDAIIICQTCRHGGHASHILEWFFGNEEDGAEGVVSHETCAVADCNCQCANEF